MTVVLQFLNQKSMLSANTISKLKALGVQANLTQDFVSGVKLMQLVCRVFYNGNNKQLSSKLKITDDKKTGVMITNVNMILNYLKKDQSITMSEQIKSLTVFKILQEQECMRKLIQWVLNYHQERNLKNIATLQNSPPRELQNEFENLYFVSSLNKEKIENNDSLQEQPSQDLKIGRKGSFKILKPRTHSQSKSIKYSDSNELHSSSPNKSEKMSNFQPLKQINSNIDQVEDKDDLNCRKTIPKMYERPPLYRQKRQSNKKQKLEQQLNESKTSRQPEKDKQIKRQICQITQQIAEQQKSIAFINNTSSIKKQPKKLETSKKSQRKIFKIQIPELPQKRKKQLLEWLISINLLKISSAKYLNELQLICKDGVIFMEAINYYRGRGKDLSYFRQPKRSAEMHSNYQKLFTTLQQFPEFQSDLIFQYEYFIPEVQSNAFWSLLSSVENCFNKRIKSKEANILRYEDEQQKRIERSISKQKTLNPSISYQQIKYSSGDSMTKQLRTNHSTIIHHAKQPSKFSSRSKSNESQKHQKQLPSCQTPYGLVQNQQPVIDQCPSMMKGYKQLYLCKFKNMQTPNKLKNKSLNSSLSKSRLKSMGSSSKNQDYKPAMPSISLQMQMKVMKYLKSMNLQQDHQQLFKDPFRNGTLLCNIVKKQLQIDCLSSKKPSNIEDCRANFIQGIKSIKKCKKQFNSDYQYFIEDLVRGQRRLLYGLIWYLIKIQNQQFKNIVVPESSQFLQSNNSINWIRTVQKGFPSIGQFKIRNQINLYNALINTNFLYDYSQYITNKKSITPTYEYATNSIQRQSNLKKVLGYLVQNKIIRSDYLWKVKSLMKSQKNTLDELINDLINHYNQMQRKESRNINFVKYNKNQPNEPLEKGHQKQRLETTMANQTFSHFMQANVIEQPKVQLQWMRKLGFVGNLQLNNGVILCRLVSKLCMKTITGVNQFPQTRAQCLGNIRRAIKQLPQFKWSELDVYEGKYNTNMEIYGFIRDRFKHCYALKGL